MLAPSSRVTARAALSAATPATSPVWASSTSVGWISGVSPAARPISAKLFMLNVLVTVKPPVGATSSLSWSSRSASVAGKAADERDRVGVRLGALMSTTPPDPGVISVSPPNSVTTPVTSTKSPTVREPAPALVPNTKMPSEASGVASVPPPVPSVCMKKPLKPPVGYVAVTTPRTTAVS